MGFVPIENYGVIGNCRTAALISTQGSIDWCCLPHFDSPSYFCSILDPKRGGRFSITPLGEFCSEQRYLGDTNILLTKFETSAGLAQLEDGFAVTSEKRKRDRLLPTDEIFRIVRGLCGEVVFEMQYAPRPGYGRVTPQMVQRGGIGIACTHKRNLLLLHTSLPDAAMVLHETDEGLVARARFRVRAGERVEFSLNFANEAPAVIAPLGDSILERASETASYWRGWIAQCRYQGEYQRQVRRSALALKLLSFAPSGAVVAAPTSSLPELFGGVRNWDYRYCWLRDAAFTTRALVSLGFHDEAIAFLSWMLHSTRLTMPRLQVVYSVFGETSLNEWSLPWLGGYRDSMPVRMGNGAARQFQLDIYGEVLSSVAQVARIGHTLDGMERKFILKLGEAVRELWRKPDDGIWEARSAPTHHTHSKVMAWVALAGLRKIAEHFKWRAPVLAYEREAEEIRTAVEAHGYNTRIGSYVRSFDSSELDAAVLVMPLFGYCRPDSFRMRATRASILRRLSENGLIYRYRGVDDGLPGREGSFGICNFWLIENFARSNELELAKLWFERLLGLGSRLGLWSEELSADNGAFLGNYPQGFTHVGLINAAVSIEAQGKTGKCLI